MPLTARKSRRRALASLMMEKPALARGLWSTMSALLALILLTATLFGSWYLLALLYDLSPKQDRCIGGEPMPLEITITAWVRALSIVAALRFLQPTLFPSVC